MPENKAQAPLADIVNCRHCAAELKFLPGTESLVCPYCGTDNIITDHSVVIEEIDYEQFIHEQVHHEEKIDIHEVKCQTCGANTTFPPNVSSINCPYCNSSLILTGGSTSSLLKPRAILPFKLSDNDAREQFSKWLKGKWFLPSDLKRVRRQDDKIIGIYIPYWTFDSRTATSYTGQKGIHYTTMVPMPKNVNGKMVTTMQPVVKTNWHFVSGNVNVNFDDTLIVAGTSLDIKYLNQLEPFDLKNLVPFDEKFLSGFRTEIYQTGVQEAFAQVKEKMGNIIKGHIRVDIGGDEQRIITANTTFNDVTFKHILLPIYISAFRYNKKVYKFLVNARTGETVGERPYDKWKITIAVLLAILLILAITYLSQL